MPLFAKALAFTRKDIIEEVSYRFAFLLRLSGILFQVFAFFFLSRLVARDAAPSLERYGGDYFSFVLLGIAFSGYHQAALSGVSSSIRDAQTKGTLEAMLLTQTGVSAIAICSSLYRFIWTSLTVLVYVLIGATVFGVSVAGANLPGVILVLILTITSFSAIGIISASFVMVFKKGDPFAFAFSGASYLLGGVYYPVAVMPLWLQKVSYVLPMRHSLEAVRLCLLKRASLKLIAPSLMALGALTAILLPLSLLLFRSAVKKAKTDGSLAHY